jgi:hypothetical protein
MKAFALDHVLARHSAALMMPPQAIYERVEEMREQHKLQRGEYSPSAAPCDQLLQPLFRIDRWHPQILAGRVD